MAAPKSNQLWKLRSKNGRDKLFSDTGLLWQAACEYFLWCDNNPWQKNEAIKSGAEIGRIISIPMQRPYTVSGLCLYLGCNEEYLYNFTQNCTEEFAQILNCIEQIIETHQIEGVFVGTFSKNILSKKSAQVDKKNINTDNEKVNKIEVEIVKSK